MTEPNYQTLTQPELREYVRMHPEDINAFHYYVDKLRKQTGVLISTEEELEQELRKRIESR
jgi:hypothetical protein